MKISCSILAASSGVTGARGRMAAHAAGIGAGVALAGALVVLGRLQHQHALAVGQCEGAHFLARKAILDHDRRARLTEGALDHRRADGCFGLLDPLPRR